MIIEKSDKSSIIVRTEWSISEGMSALKKEPDRREFFVYTCPYCGGLDLHALILLYVCGECGSENLFFNPGKKRLFPRWRWRR